MKTTNNSRNGPWQKPFQRAFALMAINVLAFTSAAMAKEGLRTKFSMVTLSNLQPGETYNTRELVNLPLSVTNTGDSKVTVKMSVNQPQGRMGNGQDGYFDPIPDPSWVKLGQDELIIGPGETGATDVFVKVPDEDKYLNKKYQADIHIRGTDVRFINLGLMANLRFKVASRRLTKEEMERRNKVQAYGNKIEFDLLPYKGMLDDFPLGKKVDIEKDNKVTLKISNPNDIEFTYYLDVIQLDQEDLPMPEGYSGLIDLSCVKLEKKEVTVGANSIKKIKMTIELPVKDEYRGKNFAFAVKATVSGTPVELNQVSRFYVTTQK